MVNWSSRRQTDPGSKTVRLNCLFTSCAAWTRVSWLSLRHPLHPQLTCHWDWSGRPRLANQQAPTRRTTPSTASFNWQFRVTSFSGNSSHWRGQLDLHWWKGEREKKKRTTFWKIFQTRGRYHSVQCHVHLTSCWFSPPLCQDVKASDTVSSSRTSSV